MIDDLISDTKRLLRASQTPKPEIAAGAGVSLRWLYMFDNDEVPNPTLRTIQSLNAYLKRATSKSSSGESRALASAS